MFSTPPSTFTSGPVALLVLLQLQASAASMLRYAEYSPLPEFSNLRIPIFAVVNVAAGVILILTATQTRTVIPKVATMVFVLKPLARIMFALRLPVPAVLPRTKLPLPLLALHHWGLQPR